MVTDIVALRGGNFEYSQSLCGTVKEHDGWSLSHKVACRHQAIVEIQGHFAQSLIPWGVLPIV